MSKDFENWIGQYPECVGCPVAKRAARGNAIVVDGQRQIPYLLECKPGEYHRFGIKLPARMMVGFMRRPGYKRLGVREKFDAHYFGAIGRCPAEKKGKAIDQPTVNDVGDGTLSEI